MPAAFSYSPPHHCGPGGMAAVSGFFDPTPPVDPGELTFLAVDTRSPYTREYPGSESG
ncbi:MAG: hypothetical protein AAB341_00340 [Planctomycetota bacterium]